MPAPRTSVVDRLRATARDLVSLVAGADDAALRRAPADGGWPAATVLHHLADAELVYAVRIRAAVADDDAVLPAFDERAWASRFAPVEQDVRDVLARWRAVRESTVRVLASLSESEWRRQGTHPERGELTVADLAESLAGHDRTHLDQIRQALAPR